MLNYTCTCNIFLRIWTQLDIHSKSIAFNDDFYHFVGQVSALRCMHPADVLQMLTNLFIFYLPFYSHTCCKQYTEKHPATNKWMLKVINILRTYLVTKRNITARERDSDRQYMCYNHEVRRKWLLNDLKEKHSFEYGFKKT